MNPQMQQVIHIKRKSRSESKRIRKIRRKKWKGSVNRTVAGQVWGENRNVTGIDLRATAPPPGRVSTARVTVPLVPCPKAKKLPSAFTGT